jgi:hypothetical protein
MGTEGERAVRLAQGSTSQTARATADTVVAMARMNAGDLEAAEQCFSRAIPVLRQERLWVQSLDAISFRGLLHHMRLEFEQVEQTSGWAIEQARKSGATFYVIENLFYWGMALANRGRLTASRSAWRTHRRSASTVQPNFSATDRMVAHCEECSWAWSKTMRTARSRSFGEYLLGRAMGSILSRNEPSEKPGTIQSEDYRGVALQELDVIHHLLRREDLGDQHRGSDEQPDARVGSREQYACVRHSRGVQTQMIGIGGDQDPAVCFCKREQRGV